MAKYILDGALRWLNRDDWAMQFEVLYHQHTSSAARALELDVEDIADILGPNHFSQISGWVFEDLLTRTLEDGRNLANDYLKRRSWKETARTRAYIAALRDSVVSIYEVSELVPGESFLARDLIRGGEPIRVLERSGSRSVRPWDRLATRIMPRGDAFEMSGGTLLFTYDAAETLIVPLRSVAADATAQEWTTILAKAAPAFTEAWLLASIPPLTGRLPALTNTDGDELAPSTTLYPLRTDVPREDLIAALGREDSLPSAGTDVWKWMGVRSSSR
ncbi:MAG: hypothetical protein KF889_22695 [Alphaproteobacteria bacterium]|nr:hypothetical protein [Alphaproteobacteria bacterium]MCW5740352.1 hypothetical protein [Alphaproteobacteria bacterium]